MEVGRYRPQQLLH